MRLNYLITAIYAMVSFILVGMAIADGNVLATIALFLQLFYYVLWRGTARMVDDIMNGRFTIEIEKITSEEDEHGENNREHESEIPGSNSKG